MDDTETIYLNPEAWAVFVSEIEVPPAPNAKLVDLLRKRTIWDE